jgi:uncharacterized protein
MIVDLQQLRESDEPLEVEADFDDARLGIKNHIMSLRGPVRSRIQVRLSGPQVQVRGQIQGRLGVVCVRCLQAMEHEVQKRFQVEYWPDPEASEDEEIELSYQDLEIGFYRNDQLDLSAVVSEQIVFEVPMKPVCRADCKGLCDQCGADLNQGDCGCEKKKDDPRLAVLKELKDKMTN